MIVRYMAWPHETTDAETYRQFVVETGIKEYTSTDGNLVHRSGSAGRRYHAYLDRVVVEGLESIKAFAGDEIEKLNITLTIKNIYWNSRRGWNIMRLLILQSSKNKNFIVA
jgi:hypothetical protein